MTDMIKGFTVTLEADIRDDDFQAIESAVRMLKGVADVAPQVVTSGDIINRMKIRRELIGQIWKVLE